MQINNPYLAWVRNCYGRDFFYLEANDDVYYFAWPAEQFGKTIAEQWLKFRGIISNEEELPEPGFRSGFRSGSALRIYLHYPTYGSEKLVDCELYINGIFPKLEEENEETAD